MQLWQLDFGTRAEMIAGLQVRDGTPPSFVSTKRLHGSGIGVDVQEASGITTWFEAATDHEA